MVQQGREGWPSLFKAMAFLLVHSLDVILGDGLVSAYARFLADRSRGKASGGWRPPTRRPAYRATPAA